MPLQVCDSRGPFSNCATAQATITIRRNRISPVFLDQYSRSIDRNANAGTFVVDTEARDSDLRVCNDSKIVGLILVDSKIVGLILVFFHC